MEFIVGEVVREIGGGMNFVVRRIEEGDIYCEPFDGGTLIKFKAHNLRSLSRETLDSRPH